MIYAEDFRTDRAGNGGWQQVLPPGDYRLVLAAAQGSGRLTVYANTP